GIRYTTVTEKSLVQGYLNLGKGYLWIYALITLISTFTILAALYVVTAGLCINLFKIESVDAGARALWLFLWITPIRLLGKYRFLEKSLTWVVAILFAALLITTILVLEKGPVAESATYVRPELFNGAGTLFLISLVGWMPTAVEASGWVSLWGVENLKGMKKKPSLKQALRKFDIGYFVTSLLAVFFLIVGWMTLYGSGTALSGNAVTFADQLVQMFTVHIGDWAYIFIAVAAFATMFSSCMTAHDAISRVSVDVLQKLYPRTPWFSNSKAFAITLVLMALVNWSVIVGFSANMGHVVGLATLVSFGCAPLWGGMTHKTVRGGNIQGEPRPKPGLGAFTFGGMFFLPFFPLYFCWVLFFG